MMPVMIAGMAGGVEVAGWGAAKVSVQRAADVSAIGGAINYRANTNYTTVVNSPAARQTAATFAARMAQLNGIAGTATPSWNTATATLSNKQISVRVVPGVQDPSNNAVEVTVRKTIPRTLTQFFSSDSSVTVGATSTAELIFLTTPGGGGSPCAVALGTYGVTTDNGIKIDGSSHLNTPKRTIRSNSRLFITGSSVVTAQAAYLAGRLVNDSSTFTGALNQNQVQIPDPYAGRTDLMDALTAADSAAASAQLSCTGNNSCTPSNAVTCVQGGVCTAQPGTYAGMKINSGVKLVLAPGRFVFTSDVSASSASLISGSNVTVLMASGATVKLSADTLNLSAATTTSANNQQLPGIVFASRSNNNAQITGTSSVPLVGVIYYPNGRFEVDGSSASGSTGCAVLIAKTVVLTGSSTFDATDCSSYNVPTFFSIPAVSTLTARHVK